MRPINEWTLQECLEALRKYADTVTSMIKQSENRTAYYEDYMEIVSLIADRIHELTRWIPVEERMPNDGDVDENGEVLGFSPDPHITVQASMIPMSEVFTHWRRMNAPEEL